MRGNPPPPPPRAALPAQPEAEPSVRPVRCQVDPKWTSHPDCAAVARPEWRDHPSVANLYCLAIVHRREPGPLSARPLRSGFSPGRGAGAPPPAPPRGDLASLRALRGEHVPLLKRVCGRRRPRPARRRILPRFPRASWPSAPAAAALQIRDEGLRTIEATYGLPPSQARAARPLLPAPCSPCPLLTAPCSLPARPVRPSAPLHQVRVFVHYPPQFYHLHVHFTALSVDFGVAVERARLLDDVIDALEADPGHYGQAALTVRLGEGDPLYRAFRVAQAAA